MIPSNKDTNIERLLDHFANRTDAIENNKCVDPPFGCGKPLEDLRDTISLKEYKISGLCQNCQDEVFGNEF